jgi:hypothetical protein
LTKTGFLRYYPITASGMAPKPDKREGYGQYNQAGKQTSAHLEYFITLAKG